MNFGTLPAFAVPACMWVSLMLIGIIHNFNLKEVDWHKYGIFLVDVDIFGLPLAFEAGIGSRNLFGGAVTRETCSTAWQQFFD